MIKIEYITTRETSSDKEYSSYKVSVLGESGMVLQWLTLTPEQYAELKSKL